MSMAGSAMGHHSKQLSASQSGAPSSISVFKHHSLLLGSDTGDQSNPMLDYSDLMDRIEMFKHLFSAHIDESIADIEKSKEDHSRAIADERRTMEAAKTRIEQQKVEQKALYNTVAAEKNAESSAQAQLGLLQSSKTSLAQRLSEVDAERQRLQGVLDEKRREHQERKGRLAVQVRRNKPELSRFNEKLGCRVSAGQDNAGRNRSIIKFTFNLLDPNDWSFEAHFVIDASRSQYKIVTAKPALPSEKIESMLTELNRSRALFTFIKHMRTAFKEQIDMEKARNKFAS